MNKMAEKNDQKMRERAERAEKFQAKLQELLALAKKKKNMLEYQEINDHFKDFALSPEQIDKILDFLEGKCSLDEAVYILKRDTRHFAKRQLTWFKRERDVRWLYLDGAPGEQDRVFSQIMKEIGDKRYTWNNIC